MMWLANQNREGKRPVPRAPHNPRKRRRLNHRPAKTLVVLVTESAGGVEGDAVMADRTEARKSGFAGRDTIQQSFPSGG